ncbi:mechanosensitive ion channel family protein [Sulfurospirillum sp. 1612]|uniref:mechanosensitive ion channel family protein n=1 Tax=Sulfurospirillum sp. 1612 TaxID=3094835 RepID=UPI002F950DB7
MMASFIRHCFIFLFVCIALYGADTNDTLINANPHIYKNLLKTLPKEDSTSDEIALQKALIYKLMGIDLNATEKIPAIKMPKDTHAYGLLFDTYMKHALRKNTLSNRIIQIKEKLKILKNDIGKIKNTSPSLLTLQLQDAFYSKSMLQYQKQISAIVSKMKAIENSLDTSVKNLDFDIDNLSVKIETSSHDSDKFKNEIDRQEIEKERFELINKTSFRIKKINETIEQEKKHYNASVLKTVVYLFLQFSNELKHKDKKVFDTADKITAQISKLEFSESLKVDVIPLMSAMEKHYLGTIKVITGSTMQEFKSLVSSFWRVMRDPMFKINGTPISIFKMVVAVFIFIIGFIIGRFYRANIKNIMPKSISINDSTQMIFSNIGYYIILIISFFVALNVLGINLSSIALVAGALSVGIGFGLQNIVSNFISGIIIMFERSIKVGDYIELSDSLKGHVSGIHMRATTINTNSNIDVIVPNQNFVQNNVINWTMNDNIRCFQVPFGVAYGTKPEKVIAVVKEAVEKCQFKDLINTKDRGINIIMTNMNNSSVDYELFVWIKGREILSPKSTISRFLIVIYNALYENNIEIPFPQQDLHIRSIDKDVKFPFVLEQ